MGGVFGWGFWMGILVGDLGGGIGWGEREREGCVGRGKRWGRLGGGKKWGVFWVGEEVVKEVEWGGERVYISTDDLGWFIEDGRGGGRGVGVRRGEGVGFWMEV